MKRRTFLACGITWAAAVAAKSRGGSAAGAPLRIGLTPVFLDDQVGFLDRWRAYLGARLSRPIEFVYRGSYGEIVDLLRQEKLDLAWLCGYAYLRNRQFLRLLAVPEYNGRPAYSSYLIVPFSDKTTKSILDLRGRVFAFADPNSNAGYLYPNYRLLEAGERPDSFFSKTFFTWADRKVVDAVATRVAHAGAVSSYMWDTLQHFHPQLTAMTRVVERSPEFGFPPFVVHSTVARSEQARVQRALLGMGDDADGRAVLKMLNLTNVVAGTEHMFAGIERMSKVLDAHNNVPTA